MTSQQSSQPACPALWTLILICSMASFCSLLPAETIPSLALFFHIPNHQAEGMLSWFLLGYGIGPLIYGAMADAYGRKRTLFFGFSIALFGMGLSLMSAIGHTFLLMIIGRLLAGIGTSAGLIIGMIILNETNAPKIARKKYSIIMLFFAFCPALAMALGGLIEKYLGFFWVIVLMPILILGIIIIALRIRETKTINQPPVSPRSLITSYWTELLSARFMALALLMTIASGSMFIFNGISSLIAISMLHVAPDSYGELTLISSAGLFFGALVSSQLATSQSVATNLTYALTCIFTGSLLMLIAFVAHFINLYTLLVPAFIIFFGTAIMIPNASMGALQQAHKPAIGASIVNAMALIGSSFLLRGVAHMYTHTALALPGALFILSIIAAALLLGFVMLNARHTQKTTLTRP